MPTLTRIIYGETKTLRAALPRDVDPALPKRGPIVRFVENLKGEDQIHIGYFCFGVNWAKGGQVRVGKRDGKPWAAWLISIEDAGALAELDSQIETLQAQRRALAAEAAARGRLLRVADLDSDPGTREGD